MWIFFRVTVGMVHTVKDRVGPGIEIRRTLCDPRKNVKKTFPAFAHGKHFMRSITVKEKGLAKKRKVPVEYQKQED